MPAKVIVTADTPRSAIVTLGDILLGKIYEDNDGSFYCARGIVRMRGSFSNKEDAVTFLHNKYIDGRNKYNEEKDKKPLQVKQITVPTKKAQISSSPKEGSKEEPREVSKETREFNERHKHISIE